MPTHLRSIIATVLASASGPGAAPTQVSQLFAAWPRTRKLAQDHRVLGMLAMAVLNDPALQSACPPGLRSELAMHALRNRRDHQLAQAQLRTIAGLFADPPNGPILLKGAVSQAMGVFADPAHRWLADLDLMVTDPAQVRRFADGGYRAANAPDFDPARFDATRAARFARLSHHLPMLVAAGQPLRVELHQQPVHIGLASLVPQGWTTRAVAAPDLPGLRIPAPRDHLILTLIHALYGDRYSDNIRFRLRNMLDAELQFRRLPPSDRAAVEAHFETRGCARDWRYWRHVCATDFGGAPGPRPAHLRHQVQTRVLDRPAVRSARYAVFFALRTLPQALVSRDKRARLWRNLGSGQARRVFWGKLRRILGAS